MSELDDLRKRIDHIDEKILGLLAARYAISRQIGELKVDKGIDQQREDTIIKELARKSPSLDVDRDAVEEIWQAIMKHSRRVQKRNH